MVAAGDSREEKKKERDMSAHQRAPPPPRTIPVAVRVLAKMLVNIAIVDSQPAQPAMPGCCIVRCL